jgi:NlpC/P60 family putative phage cell wall peptidase
MNEAPSLPERVVAEARLWIGTPYVHQASVRGAGCDCLGLLRGVWRGIYGTEPELPPPYSADWAEASGQETLAEAARRYLIEIPQEGYPAVPLAGSSASQALRHRDQRHQHGACP